MGSRYAQTLGYTVGWIIVQSGLSHLLTKLLFDAKGSYLQIMRAYMLGQLFRYPIIVPVGAGA